MIDCGLFYDALIRQGIDFFTGVPDSLLKHFSAYVADHADPNRHIIAANEGGAIALACGYHLATNRVGLVYMQNSGQGNAVNPLVSLADSHVYSIPMLLLIGWRGEPGKHDEPQHLKQGKITLSLLDTLEIPYRVLPDNTKAVQACLEEIVALLNERSEPAALISKNEAFKPYKIQKHNGLQPELTREAAIRAIIEKLDDSDIIVSTTGKTSRELYEYRDSTVGDHSKDFLAVGSMGHCSQIAMAIALAKPERRVYCFDGDGAVIMHMGSLAIIGSSKINNFKHIILNNGCHDSVGGQPTVGFSISFTDIAKGCGYEIALEARSLSEISQKMETLKSASAPALLEVKVTKGARSDLGRPKISPKENKANFMRFLSS